MSALLAFALFPALAVAEDSSGIQYSDAPPTVPGKTSQQDPANSSKAGGGTGGPGQSSTRSGSTDAGKSGDRSKTDDAGVAGGQQGGGDGKDGAGAGQGKSGDERGQGPKAIDVAPTTSADDGSSPLVPILIALAALAAISIGAVAMRRKRSDSDPGSPVSPEAS